MVILVKIVKIGQLQMSVESWEPIMHSCFCLLKHTYIIAEQKKLHMEGYQNGHKVHLNRKGSNHEIFLIP